jgi:plastocyanin
MDPRHCAIALAAVAALASAASAETIRIEMENLGYKPSAVSAHVGDTIEWTNTDFLAHTATSRDKKWDLMLYPKKVGRIVLKQAGDIEYYCRFHPNMIGRISVGQ